jgi:hypothetical protein
MKIDPAHEWQLHYILTHYSASIKAISDSFCFTKAFRPGTLILIDFENEQATPPQVQIIGGKRRIEPRLGDSYKRKLVEIGPFSLCGFFPVKNVSGSLWHCSVDLIAYTNSKRNGITQKE